MPWRSATYMGSGNRAAIFRWHKAIFRPVRSLRSGENDEESSSMIQSYSGSEILQMAVEIEEKGKAFHEGVFAGVKDKKTRSVFRYLADEEVKHKALFQKMLRSADSESFSGPYDPTEMMLYFRSLVEQKIFPDAADPRSAAGALDDPRVAVRIALSLEKDALLFFHEMLSVTAARDRDLVDRIIAEERDHIRRILALKAELGI